MPDAAAEEERGTFAVEEFAAELSAARDNRALGTSLWFENDHVRVFEVRLDPGERGPFHVHDATYFWTVVEPGRGLQRFADGTSVERDYARGGDAVPRAVAGGRPRPRPRERRDVGAPIRHGRAEALSRIERPRHGTPSEGCI